MLSIKFFPIFPMTDNWPARIIGLRSWRGSAHRCLWSCRQVCNWKCVAYAFRLTRDNRTLKPVRFGVVFTPFIYSCPSGIMSRPALSDRCQEWSIRYSCGIVQLSSAYTYIKRLLLGLLIHFIHVFPDLEVKFIKGGTYLLRNALPELIIWTRTR